MFFLSTSSIREPLTTATGLVNSARPDGGGERRSEDNPLAEERGTVDNKVVTAELLVTVGGITPEVSAAELATDDDMTPVIAAGLSVTTMDDVDD